MSTKTEPTKPGALGVAGNAVRGGLIGLAETIPGVSGGTIALVTGIYTQLIRSAKEITELPRAIKNGSLAAQLRRIDWWLLIPVLAGMLLAVFTMAGIMERFVTEQPVASRSLFMGMIATSVIVPLQELRAGALAAPGKKAKAIAIFLIFAVALFAFTSLPQSEITQPPLWLVFIAASIAVCALVLPGVSGSFVLLVIGLYAPTMAAIDQRNLVYLATLAAGMLVGLALFVHFLEWLLENHHTYTLIAMSGLLVGSLRALWPWQGENNELLGIGRDWPMALGLFLLGAFLVGIVAYLQRRFSN